MNPKIVLDILNELRALPFFPNDEYVMIAICRLAGAMCHNEKEVRWLVDRMTSGIYAEWPGIQEMRACFCSRFPPRDGINAYSSVYPDGIPPENPKQLAGAELPALPEGHVASVDKSLDYAVQIATRCQEQKDALFNQPATAAEIAAAPLWLRRLEGFE